MSDDPDGRPTPPDMIGGGRGGRARPLVAEDTIPQPAKTLTRTSDKIFQRLASGSGLFIVILIAAIAVFLLIQAIPSVHADQVSFLASREWQAGPKNPRFAIPD